MSLPGNVGSRMQHIQKLFLDVERSVEKITDLNDILLLLDREPPEFRSVAYESASMVIGARSIEAGKTIDEWKDLRKACAIQHTFHVDIGLGWAFAKIDLLNLSQRMDPVMKRMVFDGIGYYYALFKGRDTIKNKIIPAGLDAESVRGFDQGVGRRLWYMAKGNVNDLILLLQSFDRSRHADLWLGAGIACGYVGGNTRVALTHLSEASGEHKSRLQSGIMLAAISRIASGSVNEDVKEACRIVCGKRIDELNFNSAFNASNFLYLYEGRDKTDPLSQTSLVSNTSTQP